MKLKDNALQGIEIDAGAHVYSSAKINDLHLSAGGDQDIVGLHLHRSGISGMPVCMRASKWFIGLIWQFNFQWQATSGCQ